MAVVGCLAHHGDDLLDGRRVRGIELALVARRTAGVIAGHGRGRASPAGGIENWQDGHGILLPIAQRTGPAALAALAHRASDVTLADRGRLARAIRKPVAVKPDAQRSSTPGV
jgi:hypothetical protein